MKRLIKKSNTLFYHGTNFKNAKKILQSGRISPSVNTKNYSNATVQDNAVFITDSIIDAIGYSEVGNYSTHESKDTLGVVFTIEITSEDEQYFSPGDDVMSPDERIKVLEDLDLIEDASQYKASYEIMSILEQYKEEISNYIKDNYSWRESLDTVSEIAFLNEITLDKIIRMDVYIDESNSYESEIIDLETLEELGDSILEG